MKRVLKSTIALILCICVIFSGSVVALAADVATPANVTVSSKAASAVKIVWGAVSGAAGYGVERATNPNGEWEEIKKNATSAEYTDEKATGGNTYYYRVRAYIKSGFLNLGKTYGDYSAPVKVLVDPAQVKGVKSIESGATSLTLAWDAAAGAKGYQLFMLDNTTNQYIKLATTSKNTYTIRELTDRTTYKFKIRAYHKLDGITYGPFSNEASATTSLPDVKDFKLTKDGTTSTSYTIAWSADSTVSGFQLAKKDGTTWREIQLAEGTTTYSVTGLKEGDHDRYKIRTYVKTSSGYTYGNWSAELLGGTIPKAPTGLKVAANTDNGASLTWDYIDGAAGYEIYCRDESGNWGPVGTTETNHFNHRNLTEKKTYVYQVRAYVGTKADPIYGILGEEIKYEHIPLEVPDSVYPEDWDKTGVIGYLYDPVEKCFYTADDPWQRNFGYSEIYDNGASLVVIIIETNRIKFKYDNRRWMFQLWKGQYGWVLYGAEIGIYTMDMNMPVEHYTCANDEDMIQMEMELYEQINGQWVRTFGRPYERQWWHTGFVIGNMIGRNKDLQMRATLTMRDFAMLSAVEEAFALKGFKKLDGSLKELYNMFKSDGKVEYKDAYYVDGLDIRFYWTEKFD